MTRRVNKIIWVTGLSLSTLATSVLITALTGRTNLAQACSNSWVNPQTGAEQCLDGLTSPNGSGVSGSPSTGGSGSGAATANQGFASSAAVNSQYAGQRFTMAPASQMQVRTPIATRLPRVSSTVTSVAPGSPGFVGGSSANPSSSPSAFGTAQVPFTGSRVLGGTTNPAQAWPYRVTGKLYMAFGGNTFNSVCSASLIGRSLLLTAAHCIHDYGKGQAGFARRVRFVPAMQNASQPYGFFESSQFLIPTVYLNGTDTCEVRGIVCNNDIALIALGNNAQGQQAGNLTGYYGYGWNNYSFAVPTPDIQAVFGNKIFAAITQLGYPGSHDSGNIMQINTAYGAYVLINNLKNTWLSSAMTPGSSGGPWLVNLGIPAAGANYGSAAARNIVVGVTSWGFIASPIVGVQGASSFAQNREFPNAAYGTRGAGNIGALVNAACDRAAPWNLQARGRCR